MRFRPLTVVVILVAALACAGAGEDEAIPGEPDTLAEAPAVAAIRVDLGEAFDLPYGSTAVVGDANVAIEFRRLVEESRCPPDVECPTAGNAAVELAFETADGAAATLVLNTDRTPTEAPAHGYRVALVGLEPAPRASEAPVDTTAYVATLEVAESTSEGSEEG